MEFHYIGEISALMANYVVFSPSDVPAAGLSLDYAAFHESVYRVRMCSHFKYRIEETKFYRFVQTLV